MREIADLKHAAVGTVKAWIHLSEADIVKALDAAERS